MVVIDEVSILLMVIGRCKKIPYAMVVNGDAGDDRHMIYDSAHSNVQSVTERGIEKNVPYHAGYNRRGMKSASPIRISRDGRATGIVNGTDVHLNTPRHYYRAAVPNLQGGKVAVIATSLSW